MNRFTLADTCELSSDWLNCVFCETQKATAAISWGSDEQRLDIMCCDECGAAIDLLPEPVFDTIAAMFCGALDLTLAEPETMVFYHATEKAVAVGVGESVTTYMQ